MTPRGWPRTLAWFSVLALLGLLGLGCEPEARPSPAPPNPTPGNPPTRTGPSIRDDATGTDTIGTTPGSHATGTNTPGIATPGIRGRIVDDVGEPIPGVKIFAFTGAENEAATTDLDGRFHVGTPLTDASTACILLARHEHFAPRVLRRLHRAPGASVQLGELFLEPHAGLLVSVISEGRTPLADAEVELTPTLLDASLPERARGLFRARARTGPDGVAIFYGVRPGPWIVTARAPGRAAAHVEHEQSLRPTASPRASIELPPGRHLVGRVTREDTGRGVPEARLRATTSDGRLLPVAARTDADGSFRFEDLGAGPWTVQVSVPGRAPFRRTDVDPTRALEIRLPRGQEVRGQVLHGRTKQPLAGAEVWLRPQQGWPASEPARTTTDATGKFRFWGLMPGIVTVHAGSNGLCSAKSEPLSPATPGSPASVTMLLEEGARITGQVLGPSGLPLRNAVITALPTP